jgi:hypothetical protein
MRCLHGGAAVGAETNGGAGVSRHLDWEAICGWAAGERTVEAERHVRGCAACAAAISRLETGLAEFGESARFWSKRVLPARTPFAAQTVAGGRDNATGRWREVFGAAGLAACVMAAVLLVAVPIEQGREHAAAARAAEQARADALLLDQVDTAVSRSAPAPMEPLLKLVTTNGE